MAFSLSNWFKGKPEDGFAEAQVENGQEPPSAAGSPDQPGAQPQPPRARVTGRVTARVVRTVTPQSAQPASLRAPSARQAISLPLDPGGESAEHVGRGVPVPPSSRKISFGTSADPLAAPFSEPPRMELEPPPPVPVGPDVKVILEVGDFVDRLPSSFLQAGTLDRQRKVEFQSSELYSDLTKGRASVPASIIYQKCADIFSRPVSATEDIEVALPLQKLVEQMSGAFQTRQDQVAAENVGEIETPFLQVAQEDNARLPKAAGTSAGPIAAPKGLATESASSGPTFRQHHQTGPISTITPAKGPADPASTLSPPTAQSAAARPDMKRPPSTVRASVAGAKIRVSGPASVSRMKPAGNASAGAAGAPSAAPVFNPVAPAPQASPSHQVAKRTARIQIPPISLRPAGAAPKAGVPAPPAMPAQPGSPNLRPAPAAESAPTFRSAPGSGNPALATFRSTPPPAIKPPPPSFAPRRTNLVPPPVPPVLHPVGPAAGTLPPAHAPLTATASLPPDNREIALPLGALLRGLPSTLLAGDPAGVPADVSITLPFRLIEPQLPSGRVAVAFAVFLEALPAEYRGWLAADAGVAEVPLPLQEIFQHLPSNALSIRADQVVEETGASYLTPFSQKAEEDAKRFGVEDTVAPASADRSPVEDATQPLAAPEPAPAAKSEVLPEPVVEQANGAAVAEEPAPSAIIAEEIAPEPPPAMAAMPDVVVAEQDPVETNGELVAPTPAREELKAAAVPALGASRQPPVPQPSSQPETALQKLFMTEDELDAKTVVKLVSQLPGINGCTVMFGDGLRLAGNFPENGHAEGFSAMSPPFYKRTMNFASELKLGELQAFTIYTDTGLLSFFMHDDICMSVRHAGRGFLPGVREKLEIVTRELAQMYSATSASAPN